MVIGITGGIGSGKSTVLRFLQKKYHAKLLMADELGHAVMERGRPAFDAVREQFGDAVLAADGGIDREKLARIVYADEDRRNLLNSIIHPCVWEEIRKRLREWEREPLVVLETAILFETGCDALCDEVWGVCTDREIRIQRLMCSRGYTREKAESIMASQMTEEEYRSRCDFILWNDGDPEILEKQVRGRLVPGRQ